MVHLKTLRVEGAGHQKIVTPERAKFIDVPRRGQHPHK